MNQIPQGRVLNIDGLSWVPGRNYGWTIFYQGVFVWVSRGKTLFNLLFTRIET